MRRRTIMAAKAMIVLLLAAAILDLPLPAASRSRARVHLVDRSGSVLVRGPADSLTPADAARIIQWDRERAEPGDVVLWASFATDAAFDSTQVDPSGTDLGRALEAALARSPTEIVLYTDGRADGGRGLLRAAARGIPVHVFPLGPISVRDARLSRVRAPASARPDEPFAIEATVDATFSGTLRVRLDSDAVEVPVTAGAPAHVAFRRPGPGPFRLRLESDDDCPQNNEAAGEVFVRADARSVLLLSETPRELSGFAVTTRARPESPQAFDAVILDNVLLPDADRRALADYVERFGGALLLLGGPRSYALGGWQGTPLEAVSPLWAYPFGDAAIAFAIDASGSMQQDGKLDAVLRTVQGILPTLRPKDKWAVVAFSDFARVVTKVEDFRSLRAAGPTVIAAGLDAARGWLETIPADRKHVLLLTDGETQETLEALRATAAALGDIGLTVVTTARPLPIGRNVPLEDWRALDARIEGLVREAYDLVDAAPGPIQFRDHPAVAGVPAEAPPRLNRVSAKEDAQVAATAKGRPAVAFRQAGRGRVGAFAFGFDFYRERLFRQSIEFLAPAEGAGLALSVDPPVVRARGAGPVRLEADYQVSPGGTSGRIVLEQVGSDAWEGRLPSLPSGTVFVRSGRARASATIPSLPEYQALGVDRPALERIAEATGGRLLGSLEDLARLPRPQTPGRRSGRALFLAAALVLFFAEMALSTFWKA